MPSAPLAPAFARGCFGDLVATLQTALQQHGGFYTGTVDADFGNGTQTAVQRFQAEKNLPASGRADAATWTAATGLPWPELFERCLQLTARFENNGYTMVEGNFDGAGITWGVIGYTLKHGEIQTLVHEADLKQPGLLETCFGVDNAAAMRALFLRNKQTELMKWANSISTGKQSALVLEPWRTGFQSLGRAPLVRQLQRDHARRDYFVPAQTMATNLGLRSDMAFALLFDAQVQNGGLSTASANAFKAAVAAGQLPTEKDQRLRLASTVAASASAKWRQDVLDRKTAIATGQGMVHGQAIDTWAWGLGDSVT